MTFFEGLPVFGKPSRLGSFLRSVGITHAAERQRKRVEKTMRYNGTVKRFDTQRGFGFITSPDLAGGTFVHISDCPLGTKYLEAGQRVEFALGPDRKGGNRQRATAVTLV